MMMMMMMKEKKSADLSLSLHDHKHAISFFLQIDFQVVSLTKNDTDVHGADHHLEEHRESEKGNEISNKGKVSRSKKKESQRLRQQ